MNRRVKSIIIICVLLILSINAIVSLLIKSSDGITHIIGLSRWLGLGIIFINLLLWLKDVRILRITLPITLLLTLTNTINLHPSKLTYSSGFGFPNIGLYIEVSFQPLILPICILYYLFFKKEINKKIVEFIRRSPKDIENEKNMLVNRFKRKFENKSTKELEKIIEDSNLVTEAIEASRQLLKEKTLHNKT